MAYEKRGPKQPTKHAYTVKQKVGSKWENVGYADKKSGQWGDYLSIGVKIGNDWVNYLVVKSKDEQQTQQIQQPRQAVPPQPNYTRQAPPSNWPPRGNDDPSDLGI